MSSSDTTDTTAVEFRDYDKTLAKGESGRSLLEAVERAERNWWIGRFAEHDR